MRFFVVIISKLARAVIPPPRLRAKCVVFSALPAVASARAWLGLLIDGGEKACESLQEWAVLRRLLERSVGWVLRGASGKGLAI